MLLVHSYSERWVSVRYLLDRPNCVNIHLDNRRVVLSLKRKHVMLARADASSNSPLCADMRPKSVEADRQLVPNNNAEIKSKHNG